MERGSEEIVLTEHFEMHIIVIPKAVKEYKNNKKDEVLQWMMFLNNPENSEVSEIMKINDDIKEAKVELEKISQDEKIRRAALNEEIARRDYEQRMYDATQRGIKQGIEQGIEEGVKQGKENERKKIIKKLSSMGMSVTDIADAVGLTETEITKSLNEK